MAWACPVEHPEIVRKKFAIDHPEAISGESSWYGAGGLQKGSRNFAAEYRRRAIGGGNPGDTTEGDQLAVRVKQVERAFDEQGAAGGGPSTRGRPAHGLKPPGS